MTKKQAKAFLRALEADYRERRKAGTLKPRANLADWAFATKRELDRQGR